MTSIPKLTEEEKNFTRFFLLNFKVSPHIVRRFFDEKFPPSNLAQDINSNVRDIINLNKTKRINAAQLDILRGVPGTIWSPYRPPMPLWTKGNYFEYHCNVMFFFFRFLYIFKIQLFKYWVKLTIMKNIYYFYYTMIKYNRFLSVKTIENSVSIPTHYLSCYKNVNKKNISKRSNEKYLKINMSMYIQTSTMSIYHNV